ncbi:helix-turn-helix transcriptional regulator [Actinophytocola sp.]|uniref:helix-turn-helix transcriptional regulator n=1 Tax=Actinophytocola sp. TaxID=1872138 RepID=UPI0025BB61E6|nr:helix-turn-helix transcriptional regulator [Actinophytocola sp.]
MIGPAVAWERVVRRCAAATDARALRLSVLDELRRAIGFDAYAWLLTDPETTVGCAPVPAGAYNVAAQLVAVEAGVDQHPPVARVHLSDGLWVTLRTARLGTDIAVTIEETSPAARVSLFTRAFGLSARETELLGHLVRGSDTRAVAARMFLSEHTVQDHLKSIFAKTSARSRRTLLARVLGV